MALVGYSDSEESEMEDVIQTAPVKSSTKRVNRSEGGRIKIDLPTVQAEPASLEPANKRQRTAGAFSGFNSLLPAPKRSTQNSIKPGFTLKTSSEAAFNRAPSSGRNEVSDQTYNTQSEDVSDSRQDEAPVSIEPKLVGKATKFLPLSVANANKKKKKSATSITHESTSDAADKKQDSQLRQDTSKELEMNESKMPQPKKSLFSMDVDTDDRSTQIQTAYEPEFISRDRHEHEPSTTITANVSATSQQPVLQGIASDLDLSESDRRRLFGRHGKAGDVKITNFNMDAEYKANQDIAANSEATEHRAVRAIAPGKHSLQQLVNNVKGQSDAIQDKWAEGKRNRGEAGSKYGWS